MIKFGDIELFIIFLYFSLSVHDIISVVMTPLSFLILVICISLFKISLVYHLYFCKEFLFSVIFFISLIVFLFLTY